MVLLSLDFGLGLWGLHIMAVQVKRLWEFMAKGLDLAFGGFTLCLAEGSNSYIFLATFNPFFWTLNKVWPFNPTASRLGRPWCESASRLLPWKEKHVNLKDKYNGPKREILGRNRSMS
jgi:hypothetical protein